MNTNRPDARLVAAECARRIDELVGWLGLLPCAKVQNVFTPLNPTRADRSPGSFVIYGRGHAKQGGYKDFATGDSGDAMDLCGYIRNGSGFTRSDAYRIALRFLGWDGAGALTHADQAAMRARIDADRADAEKRDAATLDRDRRSALGWWLKNAPLKRGDPVWRYLTQTRGLALDRLPELPGAIRFASEQRHTESGRTLPAMRCHISAPEGVAKGVALCWGVHTTFLDHIDGSWRKASVEPVRKIWPRGFWGGAIRLSKGASGMTPGEAAKAGHRDVLAIGEGVETCLAVAIAAPEWRVWAAGNKGAIGSVDWPPSARAVVLLAENDDGGEASWAKIRAQCASQAHAKGLPLYEARPRAGDGDWNDALMRLRGGALQADI